MWKLMLVGALLGAGGAGVLGQSGGASAFDWGSLLGGAVGSSPAAGVLFWRLTRADKENAGLRDEVTELHRQTLGVFERMAPLLSDATRTLQDVRDGLEATMDRSRPQVGDRADGVLRRLETALAELHQQRRDL